MSHQVSQSSSWCSFHFMAAMRPRFVCWITCCLCMLDLCWTKYCLCVQDLLCWMHLVMGIAEEVHRHVSTLAVLQAHLANASDRYWWDSCWWDSYWWGKYWWDRYWWQTPPWQTQPEQNWILQNSIVACCLECCIIAISLQGWKVCDGVETSSSSPY